MPSPVSSSSSCPVRTSCPPCSASITKRKTDAIILISVGATFIVLSVVFIVANFGLKQMSSKLLFNPPASSSYDVTDRRLRFTEGSVPYIEIGDTRAKRVVVYLHGTASDAGMVRMKPPTGWKLWVPEYPGFGILREDDEPSESGSIKNAVDILNLASHTDPKYVLVGHSLGTGVAMGAIEEITTPPPSKLVLISPFTSFRGVLEASVPTWAYLLPERFPTLKRANRLDPTRCPTEVVVYHGEKDQLIPIKQGKAVAEAMGATFVAIKESAHENMPVPKIIDDVLRQRQQQQMF